MRKSGVGAGRRDILISQTHEVLVGPPVFGQAEGSLVFGDLVSLEKLVFEPSKELDERSAIPEVSPPHSVNLCVILNGLHGADVGGHHGVSEMG